MNMDRNAPFNLTALGFDDNEEVDKITVVEAAAAVKVIACFETSMGLNLFFCQE